MTSVAQIATSDTVGGSQAHNSRNNVTMRPFSNNTESVPGDPMDTTSPSATSMGPPLNSSPEIEQAANMNGHMDSNAILNSGAGAAAMAAAQGPKVVQTAFIHKLYNMLEDRSIQHLISWSNTNESFVMSPSNEFAKVLAQYFKHTNISSFVRQLNMYGFHKVSDVFHSGSPDSTLWEFRHGNGNFKKGDLVGLREIKRRASRHALIHRDSFSGHKAMASQPGTPAEPAPDTIEQRMVHMEHAVYRLNQRMSRTDDSLSVLNLKCQTLTEGLVRCHQVDTLDFLLIEHHPDQKQWSHGLSSHVQNLVPSESPLYIEVSKMQKEIARQLEIVRSIDNPHDALLTGRKPYFSNMSLDPHPPLSPRHGPFDESRRSSIQIIEPPTVSIGSSYATQSSNLPGQPHSYGISENSNHVTSPHPGFNRQPPPSQHPPGPPPIVPDDAPNLARRHTTADIRQQGWPPNLPPLPGISHSLNVNTANSSQFPGNSSSIWSSSPQRTPTSTNASSIVPANEHQHIRDHLAAYEINPTPRHRQSISQSRQSTPPPFPGPESIPSNEHVGWSFSAGGATTLGPRFPRHVGSDIFSAPATRRSSMASNVHSLLNPAETAERKDENEDAVAGGVEERKRRRVD